MILINLFIVFMLIFEGSAKRNLRTNMSRNSARYNARGSSRICETSKMDVHLIELSDFFLDREHEGFIDIALPSTKRRPLFVCYPLYFQQYRQTHLLGHAACRQLGYATATSVVGKRIPTDSFVIAKDEDESPTTKALSLPRGLSPVSWNCAGHEQNVAQCAWYNIRIEGCQMLTELTCGECQKSVKAPSGFIKTPGYPVAYYYDMMCEWKIEVPESNSISVVFNYLNSLPADQSEFHCASDKPYIEIIYGAQGSFHMQRYCDFRRLKNVTIPHHKVQIRFFSGLYNPRGLHVLDKEQGLAIAFKAFPNEPYSAIIDAVIIIVVCIIGLAGLVYFVRKNLCFRVTYSRAAVQADELLPNVPGREELDKAYEFQRCRIQPDVHNKPGLRLRSNGSRNKSASLRFQGSAISDRLCTTFRKLSSNSYTPRTIIPASLKSSQSKIAKLQMISNLKANLLDRYSRGSSSNGTRKDSCSSVFLPVPGPSFDFPIYRSTSSESRQDLPLENLPVPPQETAI